MPGFLDPLWLAWLGLIPFIRWLHRWQAPLSSWPVSAIFLWGHAGQDQAAGRMKQQPDPAWRRRALMFGLLVAALANPYWQSESRLLTVWIDDSLSMLTVENGETRLATAMELLGREIDRSDRAWAEISLRSVTNPARVRPYTRGTTLDIDDWYSGQWPEPTPEPIGPPGSVVSGAASHWLLTDGASEGVREWARRVSLERLIQVGDSTENSVVSRLAARRSLDEEGGMDVLVSVSNTGLDTVVRRLELSSGLQLLDSADLSIAAGQTMHWQSRIPVVETSLTAALSPADSLSRDDRLTIDLAKFRAIVTVVEDSCGPALRRAVATHPSLRLAGAPARPALVVSCPRDNFPPASVTGAGAHIRALIASPRPVTSSPAWTRYARDRSNLILTADWVAAAQWPEDISDTRDRVLLSSGELPLVVMRNQSAGFMVDADAPTIVDTVMDLADPLFVRQPEYAVFVAVLIDMATRRQLLTEAVNASRELRASSVIPAQIEILPGRSDPGLGDSTEPLSSVFVLAAMLLLLLDTAILLRARRGARNA